MGGWTRNGGLVWGVRWVGPGCEEGEVHAACLLHSHASKRTKATDAASLRCTTSQPAAHFLPLQVGLRPGRPSVRLELDEVPLKSSSSKPSLPVVHNYGHGGAGLTLAWGCAGDAVQLVQQALAQQ